MHVTKFAEMKLQWQGKADNPPAGKFGDYLGHGHGQIHGATIEGSVIWDLFEVQGKDVCEANFQGSIATTDGCDIDFEILGFFSRPSGDSEWRLASAIRFRTEAEGYRHLDNGLGWIAGSFDMASYRHSYEILMPESRTTDRSVEAGGAHQ